MKNLIRVVKDKIYHLLYLILKKDMIKKLLVKHGEQFTDDVMETFGVPSNLMNKYYGK